MSSLIVLFVALKVSPWFHDSIQDTLIILVGVILSVYFAVVTTANDNRFRWEVKRRIKIKGKLKYKRKIVELEKLKDIEVIYTRLTL